MIVDSFKKKCFVLFSTLMPLICYSQVCSGISAYNFNSGFNFGISVGPNIFVGDGFGTYKLNRSWGVSQNVYLGYDFSEILGARVVIGNSNLNWPNPDPIPTLLGPQSFNAQLISVELMYNISNQYSYYNLNRPIDFSILAGAGLVTREKKKFGTEYTGLVVKGGIQADYRLNLQFDINFNGTLNILPEKFDGVSNGEPFNLIPELKFGITYHLRR